MKNKALLAIKQEIEYLRALQIYYEIIFDLFPLENRYNHNHGPDGKFTSGSGTAAGVDKNVGSGIIGSNSIIIGKSLGASGKNYPVKLPTGNHAKLAEGTEITGIKAIAGKGTKTPIRVEMKVKRYYDES